MNVDLELSDRDIERLAQRLAALTSTPKDSSAYDPDYRHDVPSAAKRLGLPEATASERPLPWFFDGKRKFVLERDIRAYNERLRAAALREKTRQAYHALRRVQARHEADTAPDGVSEDIALALGLKR